MAGKKLALLTGSEAKGPCVFCLREEDNEEKYGRKLAKSGQTVHYFCLLFASGLCQNGKAEKDGILGFMTKDIDKELRRAKRSKCYKCNQGGSSIGCCVGKCKRVYHFACGLEDDVLFQYFGSFRSFCFEHRPKQEPPPKVERLSFRGTSSQEECIICLNRVECRASFQSLSSPCCKNAWYHKECLQRQAKCSGIHFFKCPLCNNKEDFQREMLEFGIYIPDQDAAWEMEPDAFQDLLERHSRCDVRKCTCPQGRKYNKDNSKWEIMLCDWCGSNGTHLSCSSLKTPADDWVCRHCDHTIKHSCNERSIKYRATMAEKKMAKAPHWAKEYLLHKNKSSYPGPTQVKVKMSQVKVSPKSRRKVKDVRVVMHDIATTYSPKKDTKCCKGLKRVKVRKTSRFKSAEAATGVVPPSLAQSLASSSTTGTSTGSIARPNSSAQKRKWSSIEADYSPPKKPPPIRRRWLAAGGMQVSPSLSCDGSAPRWYKKLMQEDIITGNNLGGNFAKIFKSGEESSSKVSSLKSRNKSWVSSSNDSEVQFGRPIIHERRRWLRQKSVTETVTSKEQLSLENRPTWFKDLMLDDLHTGANLGDKFADLHDGLDVIPHSPSKSNTGKTLGSSPLPLFDEKAKAEIPAAAACAPLSDTDEESSFHSTLETTTSVIDAEPTIQDNEEKPMSQSAATCDGLPFNPDNGDEPLLPYDNDSAFVCVKVCELSSPEEDLCLVLSSSPSGADDCSRDVSTVEFIDLDDLGSYGNPIIRETYIDLCSSQESPKQDPSPPQHIMSSSSSVSTPQHLPKHDVPLTKEDTLCQVSPAVAMEGSTEIACHKSVTPTKVLEAFREAATTPPSQFATAQNLSPKRYRVSLTRDENSPQGHSPPLRMISSHGHLHDRPVAKVSPMSKSIPSSEDVIGMKHVESASDMIEKPLKKKEKSPRKNKFPMKRSQLLREMDHEDAFSILKQTSLEKYFAPLGVAKLTSNRTMLDNLQ